MSLRRSLESMTWCVQILFWPGFHEVHAALAQCCVVGVSPPKNCPLWAKWGIAPWHQQFWLILCVELVATAGSKRKMSLATYGCSIMSPRDGSWVISHEWKSNITSCEHIVYHFFNLMLVALGGVGSLRQCDATCMQAWSHLKPQKGVFKHGLTTAGRYRLWGMLVRDASPLFLAMGFVDVSIILSGVDFEGLGCQHCSPGEAFRGKHAIMAAVSSSSARSRRGLVESTRRNCTEIGMYIII